MDEKQRGGLAQAIGQLRDRRERGGRLPSRVENVVRQWLLVRHRFGAGQRDRDDLLASQDAKGMVADDTP